MYSAYQHVQQRTTDIIVFIDYKRVDAHQHATTKDYSHLMHSFRSFATCVWRFISRHNNDY